MEKEIHHGNEWKKKMLITSQIQTQIQKWQRNKIA